MSLQLSAATAAAASSSAAAAAASVRSLVLLRSARAGFPTAARCICTRVQHTAPLLLSARNASAPIASRARSQLPLSSTSSFSSLAPAARSVPARLVHSSSNNSRSSNTLNLRIASALSSPFALQRAPLPLVCSATLPRPFSHAAAAAAAAAAADSSAPASSSSSPSSAAASQQQQQQQQQQHASSSTPPPPPSHNPPHPHSSSSHSSWLSSAASDQVHNLISALRPAMHVRNIIIALLIVSACSAALVYLFRDPLKEETARQTADVAKRSLTSVEVQEQVNVLTSDVVRKLLSDPAIMRAALGFVQTLLAAPETKEMVIQLLKNTFSDPATLPVVSAFASELLTSVVRNPQTLQQLTELLRQAITQPGNEQALQILFRTWVHDPATQQMMAETASRIALDVLANAEVKAAAVAFVKQVTGNEEVQASTGEALWAACKFALQPKWMHAHGVTAATQTGQLTLTPPTPTNGASSLATSVSPPSSLPLTPATLASPMSTEGASDATSRDDSEQPGAPAPTPASPPPRASSSPSETDLESLPSPIVLTAPVVVSVQNGGSVLSTQLEGATDTAGGNSSS